MDDCESRYFDCWCGCEVIRLYLFAFDDKNRELHLSILKPANAKWGLRTRIGFAWRCIRHGSPYEDDIMLEMKDVERLRDTLNEILESPDEPL